MELVPSMEARPEQYPKSRPPPRAPHPSQLLQPQHRILGFIWDTNETMICEALTFRQPWHRSPDSVFPHSVIKLKIEQIMLPLTCPAPPTMQNTGASLLIPIQTSP